MVNKTLEAHVGAGDAVAALRRRQSVFLFAKGSGIPDSLKELNDKGYEVIKYKEHPSYLQGRSGENN
jgi:hypothetical protein